MSIEVENGIVVTSYNAAGEGTVIATFRYTDDAHAWAASAIRSRKEIGLYDSIVCTCLTTGKGKLFNPANEAF
jgi:hypothetical protein